MTGPLASVIGIRRQIALERFLTQVPAKFDVATEEIELQGVILEVDEQTGKIQKHREDPGAAGSKIINAKCSMINWH